MIDAIDIKWDVLGALFACLDAGEQAAFFSGFARELDKFPTHYQKEMQMMFVNGKLGDRDKEVLKRYFPALWYREGDA